MLVKKFSIPPELISTSVDICSVISSLDASTTKGQYKKYIIVKLVIIFYDTDTLLCCYDEL